MPKLTQIHFRLLLCVFERAGFTCVREEGDHLILTRPDAPRPIVIPKYKSVPVFIIKNNMRSAGMTRQQYFELLDQCR